MQHVLLRTCRRQSLFAALLGVVIGAAPSFAATTLALVSDYGEPSLGADRVAAMVASEAWGTDYVLSAGDNNSGSVTVGNPDWEELSGARYGQFMKQRSGPTPNPYPLQTSPTQRFFPTVGNHDRGDGILAGYIDYFHADPDQPGGRLPAGVHTADHSFYDFELPIEGGSGAIRVFAMDSESFAVSAESQAAQIEWLRTGLTASTAAWNFVVLHRSPFSSGLHSSSPLVQLPFQQWGADAVFTGHDHLYERLRVTDAGQNQMLYFVNGLGGANIYSFQKRQAGSERRYNFSHGALRVTVTDEDALFEFFAIEDDDGPTPDGTLIDSYTLVKAHAPTPPVLTADFNGDGFVNNADLAIWRVAAQAINDQGDADGDGDSDGADLLAWQSQISSFQPIGALGLAPASVAVPEPAATALVLFLFGFGVARRR